MYYTKEIGFRHLGALGRRLFVALIWAHGQKGSSVACMTRICEMKLDGFLSFLYSENGSMLHRTSGPLLNCVNVRYYTTCVSACP